MEKTLTEYISNHFDGKHGIIPNPPSQDWMQLYAKKMQLIKSVKNKDFQDSFEYLKIYHPSLSRQDVFNIIKDDKYKGFVAAMLWGAIGTGSGGANNFKSAMSTPKKRIIEILDDVEKNMKEGKIDEAFNSFCTKKKNKIAGIGISYFTKILYFFSDATMEIRPLIYDNQLQQLHLALLKDANQLQSQFTIRSLSVDDSKGSAVAEINLTWKPIDYYTDYLSKMGNLAEIYKDKLDNTNAIGKTGRLEEILFGWELKKNSSHVINNPRWFIKCYLDDFRDVNKKRETTRDNIRKSLGQKIKGKTEIKIQSQLSSLIKKKLPSLLEKYPSAVFQEGKTMRGNGPKTLLSVKIPGKFTLALGQKETFVFCGAYEFEGERHNPDSNKFDLEREAGFYKKFNFSKTKEAFNTFTAVLDNII